MTGISFVVPGKPVPKGRARSGNGHHYTPQKTVDAEIAVARWAGQAMSGGRLMDGPLSLSFLACIPVPPSWSQVKRRAALRAAAMPISKPDLDNYIKLLCDGMNKVVYTDDARIVHLGDCLKAYSANPRMCVRVEPFDAKNTEWLSQAEFLLTC